MNSLKDCGWYVGFTSAGRKKWSKLFPRRLSRRRAKIAIYKEINRV